MPEFSSVYETAIDRIKSSYSSCSAAEQKLMRQILEEMSKDGYSYTLEQTFLADFKEIPVGVDQFIKDPYYLGKVTRNGEGVYDFWKTTLNDIFNHGNKYNEIILSGATRIGKTSTMITIMSYMLYKFMLYRNPHEYFKKKQVSRFTIAFANLTKELAAGVAYREFNDTLKQSPWFNDHGRFSRSDRNFYYIPEGDNIDIVAGSDSANFLGMQVICLKGDTQILTLDGVKHIEDCSGTEQTVLQYIDNSLVPTNAYIDCTGHVTELIRVELEDGSVIEGTPDHKIMLSDGTYKCLGDITSSNAVLTFSTDTESETKGYSKIKSIQRIKYDEPIPVYDVIDVRPNHNFVVVSGDTLLVSHNCAGIDETNFAKSGVKDIEIAKAHMKNLYDTVNARISGTFRIGGEVYGKLIASSSKNQDNDFLSDHIDKQQRAGNEHLYLVDEPQWKILPKSMFSDEVFHFTVGDRYKRGFVIPEENDDEAHREEYRKQGYQVIEAPAELRKNFIADYDISLRDIAGISVSGTMGFITQESITPCVAPDRQNPFFEDILVVGCEGNDQISDFYHDEVVPNELKNQQINIHIDFAETHNRTGISGCCVCGNKIIENEEGKRVAMPFLKQVFSVAIEAPRGQRQSYQKVINFINFLRQHHYNVGTISTDAFQSSFVRETLNQQGFKTNKFSVGMDQFIGLRNLLTDQRIELVRNEQQETELISVQRSNNSIFIPEDENGGHGDISVALAGCTYSLIAEKVTARPPAKHVAAIAAAVNLRKGRSPMSSSNTISSNRPSGSARTLFPRLR